MVYHPATVSTGQSLVEYSLGIALVFLVSIGGIMGLSHSLNEKFANMLGPVSGSPIVMAQSAPVTSPAAKVRLTMLSPTPNQNTQPDESITMANCAPGSACLSAPAASLLQVTGANGMETTSAYADVLSQIADVIANNPDMDPSLKDLITKLANSGHTLAEHEAKASSNLVGAAIGVNLEAGNFNSLNDQLAAYLAANPGALSPQMVSELTGASGWISDHIHNLTTQGDLQQGWGQVVLGGGVQTNQEANTICSNGGDTGQCVK